MLETVRSSIESAQVQNDLIRICRICKNVETEMGAWEELEFYLARKTKLRFSSAYCPPCVAINYPELAAPEHPLPPAKGGGGRDNQPGGKRKYLETAQSLLLPGK